VICTHVMEQMLSTCKFGILITVHSYGVSYGVKVLVLVQMLVLVHFMQQLEGWRLSADLYCITSLTYGN